MSVSTREEHASSVQAKGTRVNIESESRSLATEDVDLFKAYQNAVAAHGPQHAFLFESLQGPEQDCRQSVLGLHCLAEIVFSHGELRFQGNQAVCDPLQAVAARALGQVPAPVLQLGSAQDHWVALRALPWACGPEQDAARFGYFTSICYDTGRLNVCLSHQAIGMAFGGTVVRAANCMHGKTSLILHDGHGVFTHTGGRALWATRDHSLIVDPAGLGSDIAVTARSCEDGYVMGLRHRQLPIEGVQFHPESVSTEGGLQIFHSFISSQVQGRPHATPRAGAQDLVTTP